MNKEARKQGKDNLNEAKGEGKEEVGECKKIVTQRKEEMYKGRGVKQRNTKQKEKKKKSGDVRK